MSHLTKTITILLSAAILITAGVLLQRFVFQKASPTYVPSNFDSETCVVEKIEQVKPAQELCVKHPKLIPAKTYYDHGWKVVCCKKVH